MTHITYVPSVMDKLHRIETVHRARMAAINATYDAAAQNAWITFMAAIAVFSFVFVLFV